jgi:hypothetical protein
MIADIIPWCKGRIIEWGGSVVQAGRQVWIELVSLGQGFQDGIHLLRHSGQGKLKLFL